MAISVTSLGTKQVKGSATIDFSYADGLSGAIGDTLIFCLAGETTISSNYIYDASSGLSFTIPNLTYISNPTNVVGYAYIYKLDFVPATGDYVRFVFGTTNAEAITVYKVTGLDYGGTPSQVTSAGSYLMSNAYNYGQMLYVHNGGTVTSISADLSPYTINGTVYARVRKLDGTLVATVGSIAGASIVTGWNTFSGTTANITATGWYHLGVDWDGTSGNLYIGNRSMPPDFFYGRTWHKTNLVFDYLGNVNIRYAGTAIVTLPLDKTASSTGSDTSPTSTATATTSIASELLIGVIGTEGPNGDAAGTWGTDIDQNVQRIGTTGQGDASNITVASALEIVSSTGTYTASKTGIDSRDWAALVYTLKGGVPSQSTLSNKPAYLSGSELKSNKSAYLEGIEYTSSSSKSGYANAVSNVDPAVGYIAFWMPFAPGTDASQNKSAYTKGTFTGLSNKSSYLFGGTNSQSQKSSYLQGLLNTGTSLLSAYLKGQNNTSSSISGYTRNGTDSSSSKPVFLSGSSSTSSNSPGYSRGGIEVSSSTSSYIFPDGKVSQSKHAYIRAVIRWIIYAE